MIPLLHLALLGCTPRPEALPPVSDLQVHGAMRAIMHQGDMEPKVDLDTLLTPGRVGVGALAGLSGEATFDGDHLWISRPEGDVATTERLAPGESTAAAATLLVSAMVPAWERVHVGRPVDLDSLGDLVAEKARVRGLSAPLPFKVNGRFEDLRYHVVDGSRLPEGSSSHAAHKQAAVKLALDRAEATLVGFWSTEHAGVFTHMGDSVHVHVTVEQPLGSGHVDGVRIPAGATLLLPVARGVDSLD